MHVRRCGLYNLPQLTCRAGRMRGTNKSPCFATTNHAGMPANRFCRLLVMTETTAEPGGTVGPPMVVCSRGVSPAGPKATARGVVISSSSPTARLQEAVKPKRLPRGAHKEKRTGPGTLPSSPVGACRRGVLTAWYIRRCRSTCFACHACFV